MYVRPNVHFITQLNQIVVRKADNEAENDLEVTTFPSSASSVSESFPNQTN